MAPSKTDSSPPYSSSSSSKPGRFPTSEEIYYRFKTDATFNQAKVLITYLDSLKKRFIDLPLCQWKSIKDGGDIPWHRVYYIKYDSKIVWNRDTKTSSIQELAEQLSAEKSFLEIEITESLRLMTWNVLSDIYEKHITNMQLRQDAIFDYIEASNCDIICLQEVTNEFFTALTSRFHGNYQLAKTDLKTNNLAILSKIPFSSFDLVTLNTNKQILCVHFAKLMTISVVHLTSNYQSDKRGGGGSGNVITKRNLQLSQLIHHLSGLQSIDSSAPDCSVIIGDFNTGDNIDLLTDATYREVALPEYTYNPETNRFARLMSLTQRLEKYDRCFYHNNSSHETLSIQSCTVDTENKLSDHYPVLISMKYRGDDHKSSHDTTVAEKKRVLSTPNKFSLSIVIPIKYWKQITTMSHRYEMNWKKWMPHVHLFFPFLDLLTAEEKELIQTIVSQKKYIQIPSGMLKVAKLRYFTHQRGSDNASYTVYAEFTEENQVLLKQLQQEIADALHIQVFSPDADGSENNADYHPHMTIASMDSIEEVHRFIQSNQRICQTIEFPLKRLCYLHNPSTSLQQYYDVVDVFGQKIFEGNLVEFLYNYLPSGMTDEIKLAGSSVFDEELPSSSLASPMIKDYDDILVVGKVSREEFINATFRLLKTCGLFSDVRIILNQHMHYLKLLPSSHQRHIHFDIHYVSRSLFEQYRSPSSTSYTLSIIDENSCAVYAASAHIRHLHESEIKQFTNKLRFIKQLAKKCGIYGLHYGYLSGIACAILLSHFLLIRQRKQRGLEYNLDDVSDEEVAKDFADYYGREYNYSTLKGIAVPVEAGDLYQYHHRPDMSPMQIVNPVKPYGNVTRTMTQSSFQFILYVFNNRFFLDGDGESVRSSSPLLEGGGFKRTDVIAYCQGISQLQLFQNLFDSLYLRLMLIFEENDVFPIGARQAEMRFEDLSFRFSFYLPEHSSVNLLEINTAWSYLQLATEKSFGKEVFLQIQSA